jgi:hypothetical protein
MTGGYRFAGRRLNQFETGGKTYYALDRLANEWQLGLAGFTTAVLISYEL